MVGGVGYRSDSSSVSGPGRRRLLWRQVECYLLGHRLHLMVRGTGPRMELAALETFAPTTAALNNIWSMLRWVLLLTPPGNKNTALETEKKSHLRVIARLASGPDRRFNCD